MRTLWRLRAQILPALLFAFVPIGFLIAIAAYQFMVAQPEARQAREQTLSSFRGLQAAAAVGQAVQDAERGQRGFLLTGSDTYLQPYEEARTRLPELMRELQREIGGTPGQQAQVLKLQADLTTKLNELASTVSAYRTGGAGAALLIVQTDVGRTSMLAIQGDLKALTEDEANRLISRQRAAEAADSRVALTFTVAGIVAALALLVGGAILAWAYRRVAISQSVLQSTLDSVREGVAAFDGSGRLRVWNAPFVRMLDLAPSALERGEPLVADSASSRTAAEVLGRIIELDAASQRTGRPALVSYNNQQGKALELFHNRIGDGYVTTVLDVSEQRQTEEQLRQAQKLESVGQMTGGVAHDFNNLLTIIMGAVDVLREAVVGNVRATRRVEMLNVAAERGARLTRQMLAFARRQPLQPETINLRGAMQEILPLVRRAVGEDIVVESVVDGGLWNTTVDVAQFQSAVLNLAINSRHAMPAGGKLTIEVGNAALDDVYAARHADVEPGQYVQFAITDTGSGMDAGTLARAMDPFFTTRPSGEGSGLGLAQVYGFVKQSGGHVKIYSEPGQGTTVKLYLPRSLHAAAAAPAPAPPPTTNLALTGSEIVLLVDDDDIVRSTVGAMLDDLGYRVVAAADGPQALAVLEKEPGVALLFTDVVMPGMSGRQLAEQAQKIRPGLRVLFTSGYTENAIVHHGRLDPGVELLSKPYDRDRLAAKLRRVLDGPAATK
jgi:signal transduction histidine kinase/CheY-like chemotaxis protein